MVDITIRKRPQVEAVVTQRKFFRRTARGKVIKVTWFSVAVEELKATAQIAVDLEVRCDQVVHRKYRKSLNEDLFATLQQWRKFTRDHLHMFNLPAFEALDLQLVRHGEWLEELPWWCPEHGQPEGQSVLDDVLGKHFLAKESVM